MRRAVIGLASLFALFLVAPAEAGPEEDALEAMAACRAIKADSVRLVCMDAASQLLDDARRAAPESPASAVPVPEAPIAPTPTPPAIDTAAAAEEAEAAAAERAALVAEREALEAERAALATERAAIEAAASAPTPSADAEGSSLLERLRPASRESSPVQIVKIIRRRRTGKLRFVTDEGLIFEQALSRINFHPPSSLPAEATISFGALGSKWIRFTDEPDRKYKVSLQDLQD
jgi:hypothetical protein